MLRMLSNIRIIKVYWNNNISVQNLYLMTLCTKVRCSASLYLWFNCNAKKPWFNLTSYKHLILMLHCIEAWFWCYIVLTLECNAWLSECLITKLYCLDAVIPSRIVWTLDCNVPLYERLVLKPHCMNAWF